MLGLQHPEHNSRAGTGDCQGAAINYCAPCGWSFSVIDPNLFVVWLVWLHDILEQPYVSSKPNKFSACEVRKQEALYPDPSKPERSLSPRASAGIPLTNIATAFQLEPVY